MYYELIHIPNAKSLSFEKLLLLYFASNYINLNNIALLTYRQQIFITQDVSYFLIEAPAKLERWSKALNVSSKGQ